MTSVTGPIPAVEPAPAERIELILAHLDRLPTLPAVAARLLSVTTSETSSVGDVVDLIQTDASLTAAVLRLVSRADLGVASDTLTVGRAVSLLGFTAIRHAVLTLQIFETLDSAAGSDQAVEMRRGIWKHNLAVACAAEMIAERALGRAAGAEAFVCGLLHDLGKLALDACAPKSYARVIKRWKQR